MDKIVGRYLAACALALAAGVAAVAFFACSGSSGPTSPGPAPTVVAAPATEGAAEVEPAPPAGPEELSYVELRRDGGGRFCALPRGGTTAYLTYTAPFDLATIYGHLSVSADVGTCAAIPPASAAGVAFPWCGERRVQVDANQSGYLAGRHLGHVVADVASRAVCPTPTPTPCIPSWEELPPVVTYGPWSECARTQPASVVLNCFCYQHRTKTTIISEKNTCTGEIREKSRTTETETRSCACPA